VGGQELQTSRNTAFFPSSAWMAAGASVTPLLGIPTQRCFSAARPFHENWESKKQIQMKSWSLFHRKLGKLLRLKPVNTEELQS